MTFIRTLQFFSEDTLVTAFSWHPDGKTLGLTLSTGNVHLGEYVETDSDTTAVRTSEVMTHDLEAWTLSFLPDGSGVLSGGDDAALRFTELSRSPIDISESSDAYPEYAPWRKTPWVDKKIHGAGVTAILPMYWDPEAMLIITGSYDDHIRLIEAPAIGRRQVLAEMDLGGGVWRLKVLERKPVWHQSRDPASWGCNSRPEEIVLLVSCMHAGARIVRLVRVDGAWQFEVLAKFEEHKSMNYGSDCQPEAIGQDQRTLLTTSFYDRLLCLWRH
jgi:diphthamide biosynthesis protein 7